MIATYQGANRDAETHLTEGLAGCREQNDALHAAHALLGLGALAAVQGDHDRGAALMEESLAVAQTVPDRRMAEIMAGLALMNLAVVDRTRGAPSLAAERFGEALRLVREGGYTAGTIQALEGLGDLARDQGDHARALGYYREALGLGRSRPATRVVNDLIEDVALLAAAVGQAERSARLLGAAAARRERVGLRIRLTSDQVAQEQAMATARAALGPPAFEAAWAAGRNLDPAQAVAEALVPLVPAGSPGVALTAREVEILRLLVDGQTDSAIAGALFLSVRTVENHVARIFAKFGVHTRTAAVTAAIAAGLVEPPPA
jgi:DNA-binding CsgD family transcriptional regulator